VTARLSPTCLLVLCGALAGCPGPEAEPSGDGGADAAACAMTARLGVGGRGAEFVPLEDGDAGEVIVGYQGFIFIQTILELSGAPAGQVLAPFTISLEGHDPYADNKRVDVTDGGDGAVYSAPLSIYFNDFPLPDVVGKECTLRVSITQGDCRAADDVSLSLRDEDPCIHTVDDPDHTGCNAADAGTVDDAAEADGGTP
jgi:hypothetical protein